MKKSAFVSYFFKLQLEEAGMCDKQERVLMEIEAKRVANKLAQKFLIGENKYVELVPLDPSCAICLN